LQERSALLNRVKTWPDRTFLDKPEVRGVEVDGKLVQTNKISTSEKGRLPDNVELTNDQGRAKAVLEDNKSISEQLASIKGLRSKQVPAVFKPSSRIAQQWRVENEVIEYAIKNGGRVVIRGKDARTGLPIQVEVDPTDVSHRITDYGALPYQ
jgi:hypothetical protein